MLPALIENRNDIFKEPQVYYFAPIHFGKVCLGYAVLQNDLGNPGQIGEVFRNYLRNINNALEMSRTKYRSTYLAEHDAMTGLKNRRGMEFALLPKIKNADENASICVLEDVPPVSSLVNTPKAV